MSEENITNEVLKKIKSGKIKMKPRAYFVVKVVALIFLAVLILILSSFLVSYIVFSLIQSGRALLLGFGLQGIISFFLLFPWFILLLDLLLIIVLDSILKQFSFGYRAPLLYLFLGSSALAILCGVVINITPLHQRLLNVAEVNSGTPPVWENFYSGVRRPPRNLGIFRGTVVAIGTSTFEILHDDLDKDVDDGLTEVLLPENIEAEKKVFLGEHVFVAGTLENDVIKAFGVANIK